MSGEVTDNLGVTKKLKLFSVKPFAQVHCRCDWTDSGAKQGFTQLIVELCREKIGKILDQLSIFKKQGLSQTQQL